MSLYDLETTPFGTNLEKVINQAYLQLDKSYNENFPEISMNAGAVAISCFIIGT